MRQVHVNVEHISEIMRSSIKFTSQDDDYILQDIRVIKSRGGGYSIATHVNPQWDSSTVNNQQLASIKGLAFNRPEARKNLYISDYLTPESVYTILSGLQAIDPIPLDQLHYLSEINLTPERLTNRPKMSEYIDDKAFQQAFEMAQDGFKLGDIEIYTELANQIYKQEGASEQYFQALKAIPPQDVANYQNAQDVLLHHTLNLRKQEEEQLTETQKRYYGKTLLTYAINAGYQREADQFFHELCGYNDLAPELTNIQGDPETLIKLADKIYDLNIENQQLKQNLAGNKSQFWSSPASKDNQNRQYQNQNKTQFKHP